MTSGTASLVAKYKPRALAKREVVSLIETTRSTSRLVTLLVDAIVANPRSAFAELAIGFALRLRRAPSATRAYRVEQWRKPTLGATRCPCKRGERRAGRDRVRPGETRGLVVAAATKLAGFPSTARTLAPRLADER